MARTNLSDYTISGDLTVVGATSLGTRLTVNKNVAIGTSIAAWDSAESTIDLGSTPSLSYSCCSGEL